MKIRLDGRLHEDLAVDETVRVIAVEAVPVRLEEDVQSAFRERRLGIEVIPTILRVLGVIPLLPFGQDDVRGRTVVAINDK